MSLTSILLIIGLFNFSYYLNNKYKVQNLFLCVLSNIIIISLILFLFESIGYLDLASKFINFFFILFSFYSLYFFNPKNNNVLTIYLKFFFIYFLFIFASYIISNNFIFHKWDEFSRYGLAPKVLFEFIASGHSLEHFDKPQDINILSYFQFFILKNIFGKFSENYIYIINNSIIFLLIHALISLFEINKSFRYVINFLIIFLLIYILCNGIDRIYLETIISLSSLVFLKIFLKEKKTFIEFFISIIFLLWIPLIKYGAIILFTIFITANLIQTVLNKKFKYLIIYSIFPIAIFTFIEFIHLNVNHIKNTTPIFKHENIKNINTTYKLFLQNDFYYTNTKKKRDFFDKDIFNKYLERHYKKGIYHSYSFLIPNKVLNIILNNDSGKEINYLPKIPINILVWCSLIIIMLIYLRKIDTKINLLYFILLILGIFGYSIVLYFWGLKHSLISKDNILEISFERHLGSIIFPIFTYLTLTLLKKINILNTLIVVFFLTLITPARVLLLILPDNYYLNYHQEIIEKKKIINALSIKFNKAKLSEINKYDAIIFCEYCNQTEDPYFFVIFNYFNSKFDNYNDLINVKYRYLESIKNFNIYRNILVIKNNNININYNETNSSLFTKSDNLKNLVFIDDNILISELKK
jgi:hypothetical protein